MVSEVSYVYMKGHKVLEDTVRPSLKKVCVYQMNQVTIRMENLELELRISLWW